MNIYNPSDRTYVKSQCTSTYHAEQRIADIIFKKVCKQCTTKNGKINYDKVKRKLRKYTIVVDRRGADSTPCQACSDYLYHQGFRTIICTHNGKMTTYDLAKYRSTHLSNSQGKFYASVYSG